MKLQENLAGCLELFKMTPSSTLWAYGLSAGAVLLLSAGVCVLHRLRSGASLPDYVYGGATWLITVAVKVVLALFVLGGMHVAFSGQIPLFLTMLATGLLTGATECAGTLLVANMKRWRTASWESTVAFGLAFGCFEAILLAAMIFLGVIGLSAPDISPYSSGRSDSQDFTLLVGLSS